MGKKIEVAIRKGIFDDIYASYEDNCRNKNFRQLLEDLPRGVLLKATLDIPDPRGDWIEKWYNEAMEDEDVSFRHHKTATICYDRYYGNPPTISDVCNGDTYNRRTGIAVAYAKMRGQSIPDFI